MAAKILVLSASVGAGHLRAAQAVELALRETAPGGTELRNVDVLSLTNSTFRKIYGEAYLDVVNKAPHVLGFFYDLMDRPRKPKSARDQFALALKNLNLKKFCALVECEKWDVVVNTHFLPPEIIRDLKKRGKLNVPQVTVVTDFDVHGMWVNDPLDRYCCATNEAAAYLETLGVAKSRITVTGIPVHPVFSKPRDRDEALKAHGLKGDRPVVLQLSGGFGVGPIEKLFRSILSIETPLEVVVVAGRNEKVKAQLQKLSVPSRHRAKVMGFTDKIDELMAAADVVVTKPGGLTSSEVLARGAAMAIVNPIPGQESRNSDYLLENGAAIKINNSATLPYKLGELLADSRRLETLKRNAKKISKPQAAFDVARIALSHVR
jgi:processive 1,2-diacylglycerol beta-glucosyltransferase